MKSLMVSLSVLMFGFSVAANASGNWKITCKISKQANGTQEFFVLQQAYPQYLGGYDASKVDSANIDVVTLQFIGATACPEGDPRLTYETANSSICEKDQLPNTSCAFSAGPMRSEDDPCAN